MKTFIKFVSPEEGEPELPNYEEWEEKCYVQLMNYREIPADGGDIAAGTNSEQQVSIKQDMKSNAGRASQLSARDSQISQTESQKQLALYEKFEYDAIPKNVILMNQYNDTNEYTMLIQHSEASFNVRRTIAEKARSFWKELKGESVNAVIGATAHKQRILESKFEELVENELGWKRGEQYEDQNIKITFNTFLLPDDARLVDPNAKESEIGDIPEARENE